MCCDPCFVRMCWSSAWGFIFVITRSAVRGVQWEEGGPLTAWTFAPDVADSHLCCSLQCWVTAKIEILQDILYLGTITDGLSLPSENSVIADLHCHIKYLLWNQYFKLHLMLIANKLFSNVFTLVKKYVELNKLFVTYLKSRVVKPCVSLAKKILKAKML